MALRCSLLQAMLLNLLKSNFDCTSSTWWCKPLHPSIPETVFTTNITFLLSRENKSGSEKTETLQILKVNAWTNQMNKQNRRHQSRFLLPVPILLLLAYSRKTRCSRHASMLWRKKKSASAVSQRQAIPPNELQVGICPNSLRTFQ